MVAVILSTLLGAAAAILAFATASPVVEIAARAGNVREEERLSVKRKIWASMILSALAGMLQAWTGEIVIAVVWLVFVAVQIKNLRAVSS